MRPTASRGHLLSGSDAAETPRTSSDPPGPDAEHDHEHRVDPIEIVRIALVALAVVGSWLVPWQPVLHINAIALAATLVGGYPIFEEAFEALRERRMTMELSMTIALVAALAIREAFTASVIVLFVLVAEVLEHLTVDRGRRAIRDLLDLLPPTVLVRRGEDVAGLASAALRVDDVVVIKPGGRVPVDGVVVAGHSFVDQAPITGESLPVEKVKGANVFAGTINQSGVLDVCTKRIGPDTTFAKIVQAVEHAEASRAPVQRTADRLAGYLVYFALAAAVVTFVLTRDARATISVVIVAGACGIAAGTPLAVLGAIGRAARHGSIVKGGIHLEGLGRVDTIVLDKTGTLTLGTPVVAGVHPAEGIPGQALLRAALTAELPSEHPIAKAVLARAKADGIAAPGPDEFVALPGKGVVCTAGEQRIVVGTRALLEDQGVVVPPTVTDSAAVFVAADGLFYGTLKVADVVRPEAAAAIDAIRRMGMRVVLLTGDAKTIAQDVAKRLGVDEVHAELLPEEKLAKIKELQDQGRRPAMVGDGVNDAPALAQADVGIAMGSGTDVARESADVVLLGDDLLKLVETLRIARRCRAIIWQNFAGTLLVDGLGIVLAGFGLLNPLLAAFVHVSSELLFILNSARLLPGRRSASASGQATSSASA